MGEIGIAEYALLPALQGDGLAEAHRVGDDHGGREEGLGQRGGRLGVADAADDVQRVTALREQAEDSAGCLQRGEGGGRDHVGDLVHGGGVGEGVREDQEADRHRYWQSV